VGAQALSGPARGRLSGWGVLNRNPIVTRFLYGTFVWVRRVLDGPFGVCSPPPPPAGSVKDTVLPPLCAGLDLTMIKSKTTIKGGVSIVWYPSKGAWVPGLDLEAPRGLSRVAARRAPRHHRSASHQTRGGARCPRA
jgi:hypothetical protein